MNPVATPSAARGVHVTPRLPDFAFDPGLDVTGWFADDLGRTAAWNALSVIASEGEAGFIDAGRWLVERMRDPAIADETRRFIQQEAFHGTVHARLNRRLQNAGLPVPEVRALVSDLLRGIETHGGRSAFLAAMLAGEQIVGEIGHAALDRSSTFDSVPEPVAALWRWHFYEEVEHQAALHDGWTHVHGVSRAARDLRVLGAAYIAVLLVAAWPAAAWAMARGGRRARVGAWSGVATQLLGRDGLMRGAARNLVALTRVDFHPFDQHDPAPVLAQWRDRAVSAAWERPVRERDADPPVGAPVVAPLRAGDLAGLARFAVFATRRTAVFLRAAR